MLAIAAAGMVATSCENDNINPYDYNTNGSSNENQGSADVLKTAIAEYPAGSVYGQETPLWRKAWRYLWAHRSTSSRA